MLHMKNQKFSGGDTPGPPSMARASGPRVRASPEKSPHLSNQQPQLQFASYGTEWLILAPQYVQYNFQDDIFFL